MANQSSKDADFRPVYFKRKNGKLPLELFSQTLITSSNNPLTCPSRDVTPKKIQKYPRVFLSRT